MTNLSPKPRLNILGLLAINDKGEYVFIKITESTGSASQVGSIGRGNIPSYIRESPTDNSAGRIIDSPTPDMAQVQEEQAKDYSLEGRLKKAKEQ